MKHAFLASFILVFLLFSCKNDKKTNENISSSETVEISKKGIAKASNNDLRITSITHGTLVIEANDDVIYVDPYGGADGFKNSPKATMVLITDIHGDHLNAKTLEGLDLTNATLVMPQAVADKLPALNYKEQIVIANGTKKSIDGITVEAVPMYNLREEALKFHSKGRGNGYVLTINNERVYISGDTEDIPEMRTLKNIDIAFVCMNLPYTMTVESAASAVLDFKPQQVYPYHYRGTEGLSDVAKFKALVNEKNPDIDVVQLDWYPNKD